jgi:mono/diheme cytochrome c family protein
MYAHVNKRAIDEEIGMQLKHCFLLTLALLLAGCQGLGGEPEIVGVAQAEPTVITANTGGVDVALITAGAELWAENCARCHGDLGAGTTEGAPLPDLTDLSDERVLASVSGGLEDDKMPAFEETLSLEERNAVINYARMISTARNRGQIAEAAPESTPEDDVALAPESTPDEAVTGVVMGSVTNGTAGGAAPGSMPLTLHVVTDRSSEVTFETVTNADGTFLFQDIPLYSDREYALTAVYQGTMFATDLVSIDPAASELPLSLTIYDLGATADDIHIDRMTSQLGVENGELQVIQVVSFANESDRVFANANGEAFTSVSVRVPTGAQFQNWMGADYQLSADSTQVIDIRPVLPGETHLMHLVYTLPYTDTTAVDQTLDYPLDGQVNVLVSNGGLTLNADNLLSQGTQTSGNQVMSAYGGALQLVAGDAVRYSISGTPTVAVAATTTASQPQTVVDPIAYVLIGAGVSAILFAGILLIRERMTSGAGKGKAAVGDLMNQIAELDLRHRAGKLNEPEYQAQRAALKARLTELMKAAQ